LVKGWVYCIASDKDSLIPQTAQEDLQIWASETAIPTINSFKEEARKDGLTKRVVDKVLFGSHSSSDCSSHFHDETHHSVNELSEHLRQALKPIFGAADTKETSESKGNSGLFEKSSVTDPGLKMAEANTIADTDIVVAEFEELFSSFYTAGGTFDSCMSSVSYVKDRSPRDANIIGLLCLAVYNSPTTWVTMGLTRSQRDQGLQVNQEKALNPRLYALLPKLSDEEMKMNEQEAEAQGREYRSIKQGWTKESRSLNMTSIRRIALLYLQCKAVSQSKEVKAWVNQHNGKPLSETCSPFYKGNSDLRGEHERIFNEQIKNFKSELVYLEDELPALESLFNDYNLTK